MKLFLHVHKDKQTKTEWKIKAAEDRYFLKLQCSVASRENRKIDSWRGIGSDFGERAMKKAERESSEVLEKLRGRERLTDRVR